MKDKPENYSINLAQTSSIYFPNKKSDNSNLNTASEKYTNEFLLYNPESKGCSSGFPGVHIVPRVSEVVFQNEYSVLHIINRQDAPPPSKITILPDSGTSTTTALESATDEDANATKLVGDVVGGE